MEVINKIKIDLLKPGLKPMVNAMQADENSRVLEITLNANGDAWEIPDGVSFSMAYKKPDGTRGLYDTMPDGTSASSVDGNVVSIRLAPQMLTAPGTVNTSVVISSGDQRISTFPIIVNVIQNPAVGAVGSEDYFYSSVIGNLDELKTNNKSSLVAAINEIFSAGCGSNSGQNPTGGGLSATAAALLITILRNGVYSTDQSANITALAAELAATEPEQPEEPDTPVEPDEPDVPEVTLTSISAAYNGGDVPVGTAVTDLTGVVVKAHYSDGSTETVTGYTLSGTISEGSNTVTVSYGGKTTTFIVTGVAESGGESSDILYELAEPTTFDGTNEIKTDIKINETHKDFSVVMDFAFDASSLGTEVTECLRSSTGTSFVISTGTFVGNKSLCCMFYNDRLIPDVKFTDSGEQTVKLVCIHTANDHSTRVYSVINGVRATDITQSHAAAHQANSEVLWVGGEYYDYDFIGTINDYKLYERALTSAEVEAYLA